MLGCAIPQAVCRQLPTSAAWFDPKSGHVASVVDKVALGQVFSEYFSFPYQFSFHQMPHSHHHHQSSEAGITGQIVANVPSGLSLTNPKKLKKKVQVCTGPIHIKSEFMKQLVVHSRWMGLPLCLFNALCAKNTRTNFHLKITCYKLLLLEFFHQLQQEFYLTNLFINMLHPFQWNIIHSFGTVLLDTMQEVLFTPDQPQLTPNCSSINL
jgi:hypothetical protein